MRRVFPILVLAVLACSDETTNPGGGGFKTAKWAVQRYVADLKIAACGGADPGTFRHPGSLPIVDGVAVRVAAADEDALAALIDARTCDEVFAILNGGKAPDACTTEGSSCDGNVAVACRRYGDRLLSIRSDCGRADLACNEGVCGVPSCASGACDGDALMRCTAGDGARVECGYLGLTCGRGGEGLQCTGTGEVCSLDDLTAACDKNILVLCLGGQVGKIDCAGLTDGRRKCNQAWLDRFPDEAPEDVAGDDLWNACAPAGTECEEGTSSCDGAYLTVCLDGYVAKVKCTDAKFKECSSSGGQAVCSGFPAS